MRSSNYTVRESGEAARVSSEEFDGVSRAAAMRAFAAAPVIREAPPTPPPSGWNRPALRLVFRFA